MLRTTTNTSLLEGLKETGNETTWTAYVSRYRPLVVRFVRRLGLREQDAEDVAQVTLMEFARAYRQGRYDRDRGRLRWWLFGIARKQAQNWWRRRPARELQAPEGPDTGGGFFETVPVHDERLEQLWEQEWRDAVLRACMDEVRCEVSARTFEAFQRFTMDGQSAQEVGQSLGMTENAVFCAKRRVLRRARELMPLMEEIW